MRQLFFMSAIIGSVIAMLGYFCYRTFRELYINWQLTRGVDQLRVESAERRKTREAEQAKRLDNGCQHDFDGGFGGLPPHTCSKCGLEQQPPPGPCDHEWKLAKEPMPVSYCQKCGRKHAPPQ